MHYLAACAIYRNEAPFLQEWLEFHRLVGVERVFLYNNMSADEHRDVLAPYVADGTVVLKDWSDVPGQASAYRDCLHEHRDDARWIAFIDIDEFLFSPTLAPLPELLEAFEEWPGVMVHWANFGPSGHETRPEGLVLEKYTLRAPDRYSFNRVCKCVVDPRRTVRMGADISPHSFEYTHGFAVDENFRRPMVEKPGKRLESVSFSRLRINHYYMKSKEQWFAKLEVPHASTGLLRNYPPGHYDRLSQVLSQIPDETITAYAPRVKAAIAARGGRAGAGLP
jgi:hypothetical protein